VRHLKTSFFNKINDLGVLPDMSDMKPTTARDLEALFDMSEMEPTTPQDLEVQYYQINF